MPKQQKRLDRRFVIGTLVFIIALYALLPQLGDFKASRHMLSHPDLSWLCLAVVCMLLTYFAAAGTYYFLAYKKLKYFKTVLVEFAAMFINRLLPGGVGALGANFIYLKRRQTAGRAGTIVALNNTLGFVGHGLLTLLVVLLYSNQASHLGGHESRAWSAYVKYALAAVLAVIIALLIFGRRQVKKFMTDVGKQIASYKRRPWLVVAALMTSIALTTCNVLCLYFCMQAVGQHLSIFAVFLIFSFAVGAGTATPTPGGLGGYEAALVAGFAAYGLSGPTALALALLYRFVSYWLALVLGAAAFVVAQRQRYI